MSGWVWKTDLSHRSSPNGWKKGKKRDYAQPCVRLRRDQEARMEKEGVTIPEEPDRPVSVPLFLLLPLLHKHTWKQGVLCVRERGERKKKTGKASRICTWGTSVLGLAFTGYQGPRPFWFTPSAL